MPHAKADLGRQHRRQWLVVLALLAALAVVMAYFLHNERGLALEREQSRLRASARVVDENLGQQLRGANAALVNVRDDTRQLNAEGELLRLTWRMQALADAMPGVRTMLIFDAQGIVVASSRPEVLGLDLSHRAYFQQAKAGGSPDTLYVSEPFTTALNVYSVNLVRVWKQADGSFGGIVTATLDPSYFEVLLRSVLYENDVRTTLIHHSGTVFMGVPAVNVGSNRNVARSASFFLQHRESGRIESMFIGPVLANAEERVVAMRTSQQQSLHMDHPFVVTVSRPLAAVLAPWYEALELSALLYVLLAAMVVLGLQLLQRQQRTMTSLRLERERETRAYAERLDLALDGAQLGLWDLDLQTGKRTVDARAQEMAGDRPGEPVDDMDQWVARCHPDDAQASRQARNENAAGRTEAFVTDYRLRHKDGHWVWIHARGKVTLRDDSGRALRMTGTYLDVTERKNVEAQLKRSAELLARMSRVSRTGGWDFDLRTGRSTWSSEMYRIRELDPSVEPDQQVMMAAYAPESQVLLAAAREAAIGQQTPWDLELQMTTAKGNVIWVRSQGEPVVENGEVVGLTGTLKNVTWRKQSQIDLKIANEKLERLTLSDGLTGIGNRRLFDRSLQAEYLRSARNGLPLALLMIDIDHFKRYNDHYGHAQGDDCLRQVAQLLAGCCKRAGDQLCRYGGEEFAILLPGADSASARVVAQACLDAVARAQLAHAASPVGPHVSLSIGVASMLAVTPVTPQSLVERADAALYRAKHQGRARFVVAQEEALARAA